MKAWVTRERYTESRKIGDCCLNATIEWGVRRHAGEAVRGVPRLRLGRVVEGCAGAAYPACRLSKAEMHSPLPLVLERRSAVEACPSRSNAPAGASQIGRAHV
mgnify:CR=1 FL=1